MSPVVLVGACVGAVLATKKLLVGHGHHHGGGGRGIAFLGGYSDPYAWAPLAPTCPPGYMLDAYGRCVPAVPASVSGPLSITFTHVGQSSAARYCYGRRVR